MAGRGDIKAGRAFVELYVRDNLLSRGLRSAGDKVQAFGRTTMRIGAGLGAAAAAILAPLGAAVTHFVSVGDTLDKMALRTGATVTELSELGFAAEQSGASLQNVGDALFRMTRRVANATTEMGPARRALDAMGLSASDLSQMSAGEQFEAIAEALRGVSDDGLRAQYAFEIMGLSAKQLMPLIQGGSEAIRELRKEAQDLGLSRTAEEASRAAALGDAFNRAKRGVESMVFAVGDALAPVLIDLFKRINAGIATVGKWVSENRGLVVTIGAVGAVLGTAGVVVTGFGLALVVAGAALSAIGSALAVVLSPIGLVAAGLVTAGVAFFRFSEAGQNALSNIQGVFGDTFQVAKDTLAGIATALKTGDLTTAMNIAMAGLKAAALAGLSAASDAIGGVWGDTVADIGGRLLEGDLAGAIGTGLAALGSVFQSWGASVTKFWSEMWTGFAKMGADAFRQVSKLLTGGGRTIATALQKFANANPNSELAKYMAAVAGVSATVAEIGGETAATRVDAQAATFGDFMMGLSDEQQKKADEAKKALENRTSGAADAAREAADAARQALNDLKRDAEDKANAARIVATNGNAPVGPNGELLPGGAAGAAVSFSGAALGLLGGGQSPQKELVQEARRARADRKRQIELDEKLIETIESKLAPPVFT